jgi:hypothetical protein
MRGKKERAKKNAARKQRAIFYAPIDQYITLWLWNKRTEHLTRSGPGNHKLRASVLLLDRPTWRRHVGVMFFPTL